MIRRLACFHSPHVTPPVSASACPHLLCQDIVFVTTTTISTAIATATLLLHSISSIMPQITNPILPGFNPDPSILRVGDDYYIATSTFEWYPGVQIHHSKDLANWDLVCRPLTRKAQLDMRGEPDSCGVWAPDLSYSDGKFWYVSR